METRKQATEIPHSGLLGLGEQSTFLYPYPNGFVGFNNICSQSSSQILKIPLFFILFYKSQYFYQKNRWARPCSPGTAILAGMSTFSRYHDTGCSSPRVFPKDGCPCFEQSTVETQIRCSVLFPKSFVRGLAFPAFFNQQEKIGTTP